MNSSIKWSAKVHPTTDDTVEQMPGVKDSTTFFSPAALPPISPTGSNSPGIRPLRQPIDWKHRLKELLSSWPYTCLSLTIISFTLISENIRVLFCSQDSDAVFSALYFVIMLFCISDWAAFWMTRSSYSLSLLYWLDITAALSLLGDISWVSEGVFASQEPWNTPNWTVHLIGCCLRVTAKTLKLIKWWRLISALKLAKIDQNFRGLSDIIQSESGIKEGVEVINQLESFEKKIKAVSERNSQRAKIVSRVLLEGASTEVHSAKQGSERRIGKKHARGYVDIPLESRVSRQVLDRVVLYILCIVVFSALLNPVFTPVSFHVNHNQVYGLQLMTMIQDQSDLQNLINDYINQNKEAGLRKLLHLSAKEVVIWTSEVSYDSFRPWETEKFTSDPYTAIFDKRSEIRLLALFHLFNVLFLCGILAYTSLVVASDYSNVALAGMERMVSFLRRIAQNPLLLMSRMAKKEGKKVGCCWVNNNAKYGTAEMELLEDALHKIGILLAVSLGSAGCEVITRNIQATTGLNPLIPGKRVLAVFAFISICQFDTFQDHLGLGLIQYINKFARVVHAQVVKYQGDINRNLGESFLAIWKFDPDDAVSAGNRVIINPYSLSVRRKSTLALFASVKIISKITCSSSIKNELKTADLMDISGLMKRQVSIGLHVGWAFEGPVGSIFKIDATYLSPHVNKTARIESISKLYDVYLLASDDFVTRLDEDIKSYFRLIDSVVLKGTSERTDLYAFDMDPGLLPLSSHVPSASNVAVKQEMIKQMYEYHYSSVLELFTKSNKIERMRRKYTAEFMGKFKKAVEGYGEGRWMEAGQGLRECMDLIPTDGPSRTLLLYMQSLHHQPPPNWHGFRNLSTK